MKIQLITFNSKLITTVVVLLVVGYQLLVANAQTPAQVIITWQADNFYPSDYQGKAAVTPGTPVGIAVEVIKNGKFLDMKKANFTWLLDEKLLNRGEGLKETRFIAKKTAGDSHFLRLTIKLGEEIFENSVRILVEKPRVVIRTGLAENNAPAGSEVNLTAIPYFFNVDSFENLRFSWQINNENARNISSNELTLNIGSPLSGSQKSVTVTSRVENRKNALETARETIKINIF